MPFLNFNTNLSKDKVTAETMNALAQEMSTILGKDTKWINWMLSTDKLMSRVSSMLQGYFYVKLKDHFTTLYTFKNITFFRHLTTKVVLISGSKSSLLDLLMKKKSVNPWHLKYWMQ